MRQFADQLESHPLLGSMVAHRRRIAGTNASFAEPEQPLSEPLCDVLQGEGIERLFRHQARGLDLSRAGHDVLAVTPTASGKTLLFALCLLERWLEDPRSKALIVYPTKALARDQLAGLSRMGQATRALRPPRFEIYDGDTPASRRRKIKTDPPDVLITNPDMLHAGILANHADWAPFLRDLRFIVLDELHVYRGIFGAHVHHILSRLLRVASTLGTRPQFIAASATVGNPAEFAGTLVGRPFEVVSESGAARAPLEVMFLNPVGVSPYTVTTRLVGEAARANLKTIAFTKARRVTELLYTWLVQQSPELRGRVAPYRAGYLPEERRALEQRLFSGELSAILTTSALELGIDVGALDVCVLVGYPGSLISSWQRIGRVGRQGREGLVLMVAMPDSLDQYVVHHPEMFFGKEFERAVLDPWNPLIAGRQLVCAAAEQPLACAEVDGWPKAGRQVVDDLTGEGRLVQNAQGTSWFSFGRRPHRDVHPRSAAQPFSIVERRPGGPSGGRVIGKIDGVRVYHECHPGAVYLHAGRSYHVRELDEERRQAVVEPARVDYYTVVLGEKETEVLEQLDQRKVGPFQVMLGRLRVTQTIRGYQKKRLFGGEPISTHPLTAPPLIFETVGFWMQLPGGLPAAYTARDLHFMGGIHATEHAIIGLFPLLAIADRGDVGGISYTAHPQLAAPAVFIYDGVPGGAGLAEQGYRDLESLIGKTLDLVADCACESGCPGCIQSPQCGNGNKPLDKEAAVLTLSLLAGRVTLESLGVDPEAPLDPAALAQPRSSGRKHGITRTGHLPPIPGDARPEPVELSRTTGGALAEVGPGRGPTPVVEPSASTVLVLDIETQRSAAEVGGWHRTDRMGLALAVLYDVRRGTYRTYYEADVHRLMLDLVMADLVVGFNIDRFDLVVLSSYTEWNLGRVRTLDLLAELHDQLGFRISLNHLSEMNLGEGKAGDGLQSLRWWKEGRIDMIEQYCRRDVEMTRKLYDLGRGRGYLLYRDHSDRSVRVPVRW